MRVIDAPYTAKVVKVSSYCVGTMPTEGRERGILSPADRKFIQATEREREENYSRPARIERRREVQKRAENALLDFPLLLDFFTDEMYNELSAPGDLGNKKVPSYALDAAVAFIYLVQANPKLFERRVENAIARASLKDGLYARVDCDIDADFTPLDELESDYEEFGAGGLGLSKGELRALYRAGRLSDEDMAEINAESRETVEERKERRGRSAQLREDENKEE